MRYVLTLFLGVAAYAWACCPAMPEGVEVQIADQEVLVVYDEAKGIEHFVRKAEFRAERQGFGFLVPTPTQPELAEADPAVFRRLRKTIKPRVEHVTVRSYHPSAFCVSTFSPPMEEVTRDGFATASAEAADYVEVLEETQVAGYDAAVLKASDPQLLEDWLREHGYAPRPDLKEWVQPYVEQGWIVTAFKYSETTEARARITAQCVRMSFETERPLFPYRVPKDQIAPEGRGNLLRVFYVGKGRVAGTLGAAAKAWNSELKFARSIEDDVIVKLRDAVPASYQPGEGVWLNAFEDRTWPSGTEDLFFSAAAEQTQVEPPPVIIEDHRDVPVPVDIIVVVLGAIAFGVYRLKRKKPAA